MGYSVVNNSSSAVVGSISMESSSFGVFDAPNSGSFPVFSGESASGSISVLSDGGGNPNATIQVFLIKGDAMVDASVEGSLISTSKVGSGISTIQIPEILDSGEDVVLEFYDI